MPLESLTSLPVEMIRLWRPRASACWPRPRTVSASASPRTKLNNRNNSQFNINIFVPSHNTTLLFILYSELDFTHMKQYFFSIIASVIVKEIDLTVRL